MSSRKTELLDAALNYLLEHGVANVSLRPLAAQLGTSPRILMFHFKSKEQLLQEVLQELHSRLQVSLTKMASTDTGPHRVPPLKRFWQWAIRKETFPHLRLLYEFQIVAAQNPVEYGRYLKKTSSDWHAIALGVMSSPMRNDAMATICIALFDGLILELMNGGDRQELTKALDHFISIVSPASASTTTADRSSRKPAKKAEGRL